MEEPNALLEKESNPDWQVRHRMQHDNRKRFSDCVNEQSKGHLVVALVSWSNTWSLPQSLTNLSHEPGESITCTLNVASLWPGNPTFPREHEPTAGICAPKLDVVGGKNSKKKNQDLTIWGVCSIFPALSNSNITTNKDHLCCLSHLVLHLIHLSAGMFGKDVGTAYWALEKCVAK